MSVSVADTRIHSSQRRHAQTHASAVCIVECTENRRYVKLSEREGHSTRRLEGRSPHSTPASRPRIHRLVPRPAKKAWKCGQFSGAQNAALWSATVLHGLWPRRFVLHRARSASRSKPLPRAVGGSRRFTGKVDKSATGSVNFFRPDPFGAHEHEALFRAALRGSIRKLRASRSGPPCTSAAHALGSLLHRARSASRSKPLPRAVGGSRRFTGEVDESATGSVNFFGPRRIGAAPAPSSRIAPDAPPAPRDRPRRHVVRSGPSSSASSSGSAARVGYSGAVTSCSARSPAS